MTYAFDTYAEAAYDIESPITDQLYTFVTPTVNDVPNILPDTMSTVAVMLWRHYRLKSRGVNVYMLSDGSVVQDTATAENDNTSIPLPWITNDPGGPFSYVTNWDGTIATASLPVWVTNIYEGGHVHTIDGVEADILSAAGYSGLITANVGQ